jgi:hypothetical protein
MASFDPVPPEPSTRATPQSATSTSLPAILAIVAAVLVAALALFSMGQAPRRAPNSSSLGESPESSWRPSARPAGATASLTIDFGNGSRREWAALDCPPGATVGDLMRAARKFRPSVRYETTGEGERCLLTRLEGVAGEGPGGRYWIYEIDGRPGQQSFEVQPVEPGERVLWTFRREE